MWLAHVSRIVEKFRYRLVDRPFIFPVYTIFLGAKAIQTNASRDLRTYQGG